jgi:hypothetical protein
MNKKHNTTLRYVLAGVLVLAAATTQAQGADSTMSNPNGMHRWSNNGNNSKRFDGAGEGHGRFDHQGFAHRNFDRNQIRYNAEQRKQVMAINADYRQKRTDLFKQDNLTLRQYKAGLLSLEKEKKAKLSALLTPEQKNQLAANRKQRDENRQVREAARLERLKLHLNLSDDQVAKLKAGNEDLQSQAKAIHENDNLLPQEKMEQMKTLMAKRNDTYKSVLTPDQYTEFEKMMSHRRAGGNSFRGSWTI